MSAVTENPPPLADPSWAGHIRATLKLGLPLIAAQLAQQAITITDTVMLGWLGAEPLAASVLGTTLFFLAFIFASGFAHAIIPIAAAAEGAGDVAGVRRSIRMGLWLMTGVATALMPMLWFSGSLFRLIGQDPALADMAQGYLRIAQWALYPALYITVLRAYFAALERANIVMWAMFVGVAINAALNWALIFGNWGAPALGIRGAAWATLGTHLTVLVPLILYAALVPALRRYQIFTRFWRPDWPGLAEITRLGLPVSATLLAEVGLFSASAFMMGWLGTIALAAHGIAMQIISAIFMIPYGLSAAATVRVGRAVGRRDPLGLVRAAITVLGMAIGIAIAAALVLWLAPGPLIWLFLSRDDPEAAAIVAAGTGLLAVAAVFQLVDTLQVISVSLLRGLKDTRRPMLIAILSYWALGLPAAYLLGFTAGFGGPGVWGGLAVGLSAAAILLTWRFLHRERLGLVRLG
ncbi:MAG: MATE family efflux transporter [Pseudomonadota bacterium]